MTLKKPCSIKNINNISIIRVIYGGPEGSDGESARRIFFTGEESSLFERNLLCLRGIFFV